LHYFESEGEAQILESLDTEGQSRILTTGGEADAINLFGCGSAALCSQASLRCHLSYEGNG